MKGINTILGGPDNLLTEISEIETLTNSFVISLRTAFCSSNRENYITIQRVNTECEQLKAKVRKILEQKMAPLKTKFKITQVAESALFYINKFEEAKLAGIAFDGDIIMKLAESKTKKR